MIKLKPYYAYIILLSSSHLLVNTSDAAPRTLADLEEQTPIVTIPKVNKTQASSLTKNIDAEIAKQMLELASESSKPAEINSYLDVATKIKLQNRDTASTDALLTERAAFYDKHIAKLPATQVNADMYYEAASIHDNLGNPQKSIVYLTTLLNIHPASKYSTESRFRLAELYFQNKQYRQAINFYQQVLNDPNNKLANQSRYLLAWSYLKDGQHELALTQFNQLNTALKVQPSMSKSDQQLLDDSYEAIAVIYTETGGEGALNTHYAKRPLAEDEAQVYSLVANKFLEQKQSFDAGKVYEDFINRRPLAPQTLDFSRKQIAIYEQAGLASDIIRAKEAFINNFDENSPYYQQTTLQNQANVRLTLIDYTQTLAKHYHAIAERTKTPQSYVRPAYLYEQLISLLPKGSEKVQTTELLAATLYESRQFDKALPYFEQLAYELPSQNPEDNAYFGLLSIQALKQNINPNEKANWFAREKSAGTKFAQTFPTSENAYPVLAALAAQTLDTKDLAATATLAQTMIKLPRITTDQLKTSLILLANSQFDLKQWANAEQNYHQVLKLNLTESERGRYQNQLSASLYQQARDLAAAGNMSAAAGYYSQSSQTAADPELKINAAYQAILVNGNEPSNIPAWLAFYQQYPQHALATDIPERVLAIQERDDVKNWSGASNTYQLIFERDIQRDRNNALIALWRAADVLDRYNPASINTKTRVLNPRQIMLYQHYLAQPDINLSQRIEATQRLFMHAQNTKDQALLQAQYQAYKQLYGQYARSADPEQLSQLREMASLAQVRENEPILYTYQTLGITPPLRDSIALKAKALEQVVQSQKILLDLKSANFVTQAQYTLGKSYLDFYNAVAAAPIPAELSGDELAIEEYKLQIEEQTQSFKDKAVQWHTANAQLAINAADKAFWDSWIAQSFYSLTQMSPGRYSRPLLPPDSSLLDSELLNLAQQVKASSNNFFVDQNQYSGEIERLERIISARQAALAKQFPERNKKAPAPEILTLQSTLTQNIANAYWFKGILQAKQGHFPDALTAFKQAEISAPLHKESTLAQAIILEVYQGRLSDALSHYERYLVLDSNNKSAQKWLNVVQKGLGLPLTNFKPISAPQPEPETMVEEPTLPTEALLPQNSETQNTPTVSTADTGNIATPSTTETPLGNSTQPIQIPTEPAPTPVEVAPVEQENTSAKNPPISSATQADTVTSELNHASMVDQTTQQDQNTVQNQLASPVQPTVSPNQSLAGQEIPLNVDPNSNQSGNSAPSGAQP